LAYNEQMAAPPPEVDKVDYILFTAKEAYCDYYASSMIVMLRSLGIPARLAAGFARGTYNPELDVFHVVNADAHSWVEVYFPHYGWVEFEPTAAQPTVARPTEPEDNSQNPLEEALNDGLDRNDLPERPENIPIDDEAFGAGAAPLTIGLPWLDIQITVPWSTINAGFIVIGILLLAGLAGLAWWGRKQLNKPTENVAALYQQMVRLAGWMGIVRRPWQTPYEHATLLEHVLPAHRGEINMITGEYVRHTFSPPGTRQGTLGRNAAHFSSVMEANFAWQQLRTDMLKSAFKRRLPRWLKRS
jgi:hypothetical protein